MRQKETDIVIVGSGPGGSTLARKLAESNSTLRVLLLERGRDWRAHPLYGTYPGALLYTDRFSFLFTKQGLNIIRPLLLGGATSMYCACAAPPPAWWHERYGIALDDYARQAADELGVAPLPEALRGSASARLAAAAADVGQTWLPQDKFMSPARASKFDCDATCMLGCRCGAKWNAAEFADQAVAAGCELWTRAEVEQVLASDGTATGVRGRVAGESFTVSARAVVIAAGGIGSAHLLQQSGLEGAGQGMTMDTTVMVYGQSPCAGNGNEPPMTWSCEDDDLGVMYSTLIDPWLNYPVIMLRKGPGYAATWRRWGQTLGVMIKLKDEVSGRVTLRNGIDKGLTTRDRQRLSQAEAVAGQILLRAGCEQATIFTTPLRGTHPSGTVRIGAMLSTDLETEVQNLFVCDASVFPEALARPTVLTIISLARRLGDHLLARFATLKREPEAVSVR